MTETVGATSERTRARPAAIDCDLHNNVPNVRALFPYLPVYWREHINQTLFKGPVDVKQLRAIRHEIQTVLTMLSRKC